MLGEGNLLVSNPVIRFRHRIIACDEKGLGMTMGVGARVEQRKR